MMDIGWIFMTRRVPCRLPQPSRAPWEIGLTHLQCRRQTPLSWTDKKQAHQLLNGHLPCPLSSGPSLDRSIRRRHSSLSGGLRSPPFSISACLSSSSTSRWFTTASFSAGSTRVPAHSATNSHSMVSAICALRLSAWLSPSRRCSRREPRSP
ncbi:hypothetical protein VTK73DRAFT_3466 [Phialemonium thermophilum]|uniref:Uncharacterized protein n=1 Tax=Phialemonium thermophilum TaxID=223376 RepID=A0ABR3VHW8_9PEZI